MITGLLAPLLFSATAVAAGADGTRPEALRSQFEFILRPVFGLNDSDRFLPRSGGLGLLQTTRIHTLLSRQLSLELDTAFGYAPAS